MDQVAAPQGAGTHRAPSDTMTSGTDELAPPTISKTAWSPGDDKARPNPWYDVANFVQTAADSYQPRSPFRLTSLPAVLIYLIATLLPKESAVALALSSRAMFSLLGPHFFTNLDPQEHWRLLLLLERDADLLVACQECNKLHGPCAPIASAPNRSPLYWPDLPNLTAMTCLRNRDYQLPEGVTTALCRLLAKRYIRRQPYSELLTMAGRTKVYIRPDFKVFSNTTIRIIDGSLFVREETLVAPLTVDGELTGRSAYSLNEIIHGLDAHPICSHLEWVRLGLNLSHDRAKGLKTESGLRPPSHERRLAFGTDDRFATAHETGGKGHPGYGGQLGQFPQHIPPCYNSTPIPHAILAQAFSPGLECAVLHPQPCTKTKCVERRARFRVNLVRGCKKCDTDMCFSAQDVQGIGRVIAMTTWKNLGGVYEGQPATWFGHRNDEQGGRRCEDVTKGSMIHAAFENVELLPTGEAPVCWHTPFVGRRVTALFTGVPNIPDEDWERHIPRWRRWLARN